MRKTIAVVLLLFCIRMFYAQEAKKKVLIVPLEVKTITENISQGTLENTQRMIFESLYNTVGLLPFVDSPDSRESFSLDSTKTPISELEKKYQSDYIIHGSLTFQGDPASFEAVIFLKIRSRSTGDNILEKQYKTAIDLDIFDTVDRVIIDSIQSTFKIVPRFAVVNFQEFNIRDDSYIIKANNKIVARVENTDFNMSLKVLAGNEYNFMIIRDRDQSIVLNLITTLKENSIQDIRYQGYGRLQLEKIKGRPDEAYTIMVNGRQVQENSIVTNLDVTKQHSILVTDSQNRIFDEQSFMIRDGEFKSIRPGKIPLNLALRLFSGGNAYGGLGLDLVMNKKLWMGIESSYLHASSQNTNASFHLFTFSFDGGYPFFKLEKFTLGAGLGVSYYLATPADQLALTSSLPPAGMLVRGYIQAQWLLFYGRFGVNYNMANSTPGVYISLGLRI